MPHSLKEIILLYVDEAPDIGGFKNVGDFVRAVITGENPGELQLQDTLRQLHADLAEAFLSEPDHLRRLQLKAALAHFEADFANDLVPRETESIAVRRN